MRKIIGIKLKKVLITYLEMKLLNIKLWNLCKNKWKVVEYRIQTLIVKSPSSDILLSHWTLNLDFKSRYFKWLGTHVLLFPDSASWLIFGFKLFSVALTCISIFYISSLIEDILRKLVIMQGVADVSYCILRGGNCSPCS